MKHVPRRHLGGSNAVYGDTCTARRRDREERNHYSEAELTERTRHQARIGPCAPGTYRASNGVTLAKSARLKS